MNEIKKQEELQTNIELLGTMLNYPRFKKAEILFGSASDDNIKKVDELQAKYYPVY